MVNLLNPNFNNLEQLQGPFLEGSAEIVLTPAAQEIENGRVLAEVDSMITKLLQAKDNGFKLGIFVGRDHDQIIPQEQGWAWCSLDINPVNNLSKDRLHLKMDFNDSCQMNKIKKLFDKVVLDFSVMKFMDNPWITLNHLLVPQPHAELIAESWTRICGVGKIVHYDPNKATMNISMNDEISYFKSEEDAFKSWVDGVGEEEKERCYQDFVANMPEDEKNFELDMYDGEELGLRLQFMRSILKEKNLTPAKINYVPELLERIRAFLLTRFEIVQLNQGFHPYREGPEAIECDYWVIKHPKSIY